MKKMFALMLAAMMMFGSAAMAATPTDLVTEPAPSVTETPTEVPAQEPTEAPAEVPTQEPTEVPAQEPTEAPVEVPTQAPTEVPTQEPTEAPTEVPTQAPTEAPAEEATPAPTATPEATEEPAVERSVKIGLLNGNTVYDGDRVGLRAELTGYENVAYTIQWQLWNAETQSWDDIAGAVTDTLWLDVTEAMNGYQYQVLVTVA